ncbi:MAG: NAD(P)H-dependent oxidoreductase [Bacteroidia bacterium]|nr:NAD(P)H-dependent oxidoreductase [Bacteroidia bacterium]MCX7764537.1 NAD(P)H-dependent oxidoreductase [Bacteroidia bacterium]MDW8057832.1 NAD(P)H-dependent oxidoreductase [Bacteroidia bacterium]
MNVAILSATHRPGSYTRRVALYVAREIEAAGVPYHFVDFQTLPRDFLFSDLFGARSETFSAIIDALERCSAWVWVVPEYNGSFPGIVKVFIDALPRETLRGRRAGLIGVSDGRFGNLRGLEHLTGILHYCQMTVEPFRAHLMRISSFWDEARGMPAPAYQEEIKKLLGLLLPQVQFA